MGWEGLEMLLIPILLSDDKGWNHCGIEFLISLWNSSVFSHLLDWINQVYLRANHARLKAAHTYVTDELKTLGVPFLNRNAGFFVWIDFRKVSSLRKGGYSWGWARCMHHGSWSRIWNCNKCINMSSSWWVERRYVSFLVITPQRTLL